METETQDRFEAKPHSEEYGRQQRPPKPNLRASTSIIVFLIFIAGQFLGAFAFILFAIFRHILTGGEIENSSTVHDLMASVMPELSLTSALGGALGLTAGVLIVKKALRENSPYGAAWTVGHPKAMVVSMFWGACAALVFLMFPLFITTSGKGTGGPLTQMATQAGMGQLVWIIIGLLMAPIIEELLFRGVLLGGLNRSLGIARGVIVSNVLFVAIHYTEAIHYWPAFIGIALLGGIATRQRLRFKAIGPAMATHFGYNFIIVAVVLQATLGAMD